MEIGSYCHFCHQLDFLPFKCHKCQLNYCLKHYPSDKHICIPDKKKKIKNNKMSVKCQYPNCRKKTVTPYLCQQCHKYYCLTHRFHDLH